jgi:hypothetical protein
MRQKFLQVESQDFQYGESRFSIAIRADSKYKYGCTVIAFLAIELKERDLALLLKIQYFFGVGTIQHIKTKRQVLYVVNSVKPLHRVVIPHFYDYHLLTEKIITFFA